MSFYVYKNVYILTDIKNTKIILNCDGFLLIKVCRLTLRKQ